MAYDQRLSKVMATMADLPLEISYMDRGGIRSQKTYFSNGIFFYLEWNIRLFLYLLKQKPQAIYGADIDTALSAIFYKFLNPKLVFILDLHELYTDTPELLHSPLKRKIWSWVEFWGFRKADGLITVNTSLQDIFYRRYHRKAEVISNMPMFKVLDGSECFNMRKMKVLYYQGALNVGRGLECAIETMSLLPDWKLWLVGSGDLDCELRTLVKDKGLVDRVVFWGRKLPQELPKLAKQATIGLNLLESESLNYYYSLANKFFDYMQVGLPSVNMDFPEYRNILQNHKTGVVIKDLHAEVLREAIHSMTQDVNVYRTYVNQSLEAAKVYTWENEADKLKQLLSRQFFG
ncbi:glycosyltransferase [Membranihabitans marinus]|uniref:glycosyltransferase n=1 Tax=Membranihabitans marinus TaxID=1227546 RepID=UPI001F1E05DF|nr:glycosyltransferase [Membranihabitans marinus]